MPDEHGRSTVAEQNDRPPLIVALEWVNKITTFGFILALPPLGGWWLDRQFDSKPWGLIVGAVLGFFASFSYLFKIVKPPESGHQ